MIVLKTLILIFLKIPPLIETFADEVIAVYNMRSICYEKLFADKVITSLQYDDVWYEKLFENKVYNMKTIWYEKLFADKVINWFTIRWLFDMKKTVCK